MQDDIATETVFRPRASETDFEAHIQRHINRAISDYENRRFWFNEQIWELDTEAGRAVYAMPWDYVRMISLFIDTPREKLRGVSAEQIQDYEASSGEPELYSTFANQYWLYPNPDGVYKLRLWGVARFAPLVEAGDSNPWTTDGYDLIVEATKARIFHKVLHQPDAAAQARNAADVLMRDLLRKTQERIPQTGVTLWL